MVKKMELKQILKKIKSVLFPEIWCCAVRFGKDGDSLLSGNGSCFSVLPDSYRYWTADPFVVNENDKYYLFFEMYDRIKRKGLLGCREISESGFGKMHVIYESTSHLSYPFIYKKDSVYYIVPESNKSGELFRLRCVDFPLKWEKEKVLLHEKLVDTTIFTQNGTDFYISQRVSGDNVFDRIDLFYDKNSAIEECLSNPVKKDLKTARCAGRLFEHGGKLIRPSQNCADGYGAGLNFNEVLEISENTFKEKLISVVLPEDIKLNLENHFTGIHTYNRIDNVEAVDLKRKSKINVLNIIGAILKLFKL